MLTVDPRDYEGRLDPALAASVPPEVDVVRCRAWPLGLTRRFGIGDLGLRALPGLGRAAARLMRQDRFNAVFITIYPTYPALLGPWLKRRFGVPFVLDYQDPWVGEWGRSVGGGPGGKVDPRSRASHRIASWLEPMALCRADAVTAVSRATLDQALARNPAARPVATLELPIGWDRRDLELLRKPPAARPRPAPDRPFQISYVGTLLPTGTDTLRTLFAGIGRLRQSDPALVKGMRMRFVGTSNQRTPHAPARVMPIARELHVDDIVTEEPERLDYFDALRVLVESDAVLLLGSRDVHYTPSKVFPALLSERPLLALYHEESTVVDLLQRLGGPPSVRLVTYSDLRPVTGEVDTVAAELRAMLTNRCARARAFDCRQLESSSAYVLAGKLAGILETVSCVPSA